MTIDAATFVGNLDQTLPAITDLISEGDDHLRTIKTCIKNSFPNISNVVGAADGDLAALGGSSNILVTPTSIWALWQPLNWTILSGAGRLGVDGRFHGHIALQALVAGSSLGSLMKCPAPSTAGVTPIFTSWFSRAGVSMPITSFVFGQDFNTIDIGGVAGAVQINDLFYLNWNYHTR